MLRLIDRLRKRFQRDKGYLVIEATFVYPLIFFVLMFLLYMGNMYYLKARIDSEVSQEAVYYAAQYADPNLKTIENGVPASAEGNTRVTDNLYRYVNFLDIGDFGKADTKTKNALIERISDTGLFSGMTPYDIDVVKHEVNNYVIYQTYEVEVSYKINIPIRFLFTDEITLADMSAREEAAVTDTSEFIRNVDMAVDYVERSKSGDQFIAKINEVYGRVNEFINGEKYDPSDAAAGGSPGGGTDLSSLTVEERQALADKAAQDYNAKYNSYAKAVAKGYVGVEKTPNGGPSFANSEYIYKKEGNKVIVTIKATGSRKEDFKQADKDIKEMYGIESRPEGYTWHHLDDYNVAENEITMELVVTKAHEASYPHSGGCAQYKAATGKTYKS